MDGLKLFAFGFNLLYFRIKGVLKPLETLRDLDVICHIKMAGNHDGEVSAFSFY